MSGFAPANPAYVNDLIEGAPLTIYGDSLSCSTAAIFGNMYSSVTYPGRMARRLGSYTALPEGSTVGPRLNNRSVVGWRAMDCCLYSYGSFTAAAGGGSAVAGTWAPSSGNLGLVFVYVGRNDSGVNGIGSTPAQHQTAYQNALIALLRNLRSQSILFDTNAAFVYTGTWTANSGNTFFANGTTHSTTTVGDHVTVTTPVGTDFDLVVASLDNAIQTGSAFTLTVDGTSYAGGYVNGVAASTLGYPTTTQQQAAQAASFLNQGFCQMAIPLHGLSNAAHTIVLTQAGSAGQALYVQGLLQQSPNPPTIVIPKIAYIGATGYAFYGSGASTATDDTYNALIDAVVKLMPAAGPTSASSSDGSVISINQNSAGWVPLYGAAGMLSSLDTTGVHANDAGTAFQADLFMNVLNSLSRREGLVTV